MILREGEIKNWNTDRPKKGSKEDIGFLRAKEESRERGRRIEEVRKKLVIKWA